MPIPDVSVNNGSSGSQGSGGSQGSAAFGWRNAPKLRETRVDGAAPSMRRPMPPAILLGPEDCAYVQTVPFLAASGQVNEAACSVADIQDDVHEPYFALAGRLHVEG